MMVRMADGREAMIDFREAAPAGASADMFLDPQGKPRPGASLTGWLAAGVPGTVQGLEVALSRFGTKTRADLMEPAIALAREGFALTAADAAIIAGSAVQLARDPEAASVFFKDGRPLARGDRLVQPKLAATLSAISMNGTKAFYEGPIAQSLATASKAGGGVLNLDDLAGYRALVRDPIHCAYRGFEILSAPPPSSGGTAVCEILRILEGYPVGYLGFGSADTVHLMTEAMRHAYLDRNTRLGDPAFVANPVEQLTSRDYAALLRQAIDRNRATPSGSSRQGAAPHEGMQTTHFSVIDAAGNAVAVTYSLNAYFGAKVMAPGTGFFLNDTMDDFTIKAGAAEPVRAGAGRGQCHRAGQASPELDESDHRAREDAKPFLVLGSPGGSRIISAVVQTIVNVVDHGMSLQEAVDAPRIHHQWQPDILYAEPFALAPDVVRALSQRGHHIELQKPWGSVEAIMSGADKASPTTLPSFGDDTLKTWRPAPGSLYGANDNRRPAGAAIGE